MTRILLRKAADHLAAFQAPSQAKLDAGNYRKLKLRFQGLPISVENPRGSLRAGVGPDGKRWATGMQHHYGYIRGTLGVDGDHFDCFVGPHADATHAYLVTTMRPPEFVDQDEQKAMLGFPTQESAAAAFLQHFDDPRFLGPVAAMPMEEFKAKVRTTRADPRMLKAVVILRG